MDCHEFMLILFDRLENILKKSEQDDLLNS